VSQTNFFMVERDEQEFLAFLRSRPGIHFLVGRFHDKPDPEFEEELPPFGDRREVQIVNAAIRWPLRLSARGAAEFEGKYLLDLFRDPHIELRRCHVDNGCVLPGRIYTKVGWLPDPSENRVLRSWYDSVARWLKKRYKKTEGPFWLGPAAAEWVGRGGRALGESRSRRTRS